MEMHFIELPKFIKKNPEARTKLEQWLWLIVGREDKLEMAKKENKKLEKAMEIIKQMSMNTEEWERFTSRQKAIINYNSGILQAKEDGEKIGIQKGEKIGIKKRNIEIAKELLKLGIKTEDILKATGLQMQELEKLKEN